MSEPIKLTSVCTSYWRPGDGITIIEIEGRWKRLRRLLTRPRVHVIDRIISRTQMTARERRMTWREWWSELRAAMKDK